MFHRHARKHFSQAEGSQLDEVRQVMGMLAFPPDTHISPYKVSRACGLSGLGRAWAWDRTPHALSPSRSCLASGRLGSEPHMRGLSLEMFHVWVPHLSPSPFAPCSASSPLSFHCSSWPWRSTWGLGRCGHIALLASLLSIARVACLAS